MHITPPLRMHGINLPHHKTPTTQLYIHIKLTYYIIVINAYDDDTKLQKE